MNKSNVQTYKPTGKYIAENWYVQGQTDRKNVQGHTDNRNVHSFTL